MASKSQSKSKTQSPKNASKPAASKPAAAPAAIAEPVQQMFPQAVFPALQNTLDRFIGPDSDYTQSVKRLEKAKADLAIAERIAEFEARKLEAILRAVDAPEIREATAAKWWDEPLRRLLLGSLPESVVLQWRIHGVSVSEIEDSVWRLNDEAGQDTTNALGHPVSEALVLDPAYDSLFELVSYAEWVKSGSRWDTKPKPISEDLFRQCHRVLGVPTPEQVKARVAAEKKAARSSPVKPGRSDERPSPTKPAPSKPTRSKSKTVVAAKAREVAELAKSPAAKRSAQRPPGNAATTKAVISPRGSDGQYRVSRRSGGHTRTLYLGGTSARDVRRFLVETLGVPDSVIVDQSGETSPATPNVATPSTPTASTETAPPIPLIKPPFKAPISDGTVLVARDGRWRADSYEVGVLDDTYEVCPAADEVEHAIRVTCRILSLDPKDLRVVDPESGELLAGTAADLLKAEAAAASGGDQEKPFPAQTPFG